MARTCDECERSLGSEFLVYPARKVQFDFCSRECERSFAERHSRRPHGTYCDYCMYTLDSNVEGDPKLTIRFGKYTADFCCSAHRTKWFSKHLVQSRVAELAVNFRLALYAVDDASCVECDDLETEDLVEGCEAFDLVDLGDAADLCMGDVPVFTIIKLLS